MNQSSVPEADILCYFTNMPTPRMQKIIRAASKQGQVSVIYWKRSDMDFQSGLADCATEIPVSASFLNNRGVFRMIAFLLFAVKSWRLLQSAKSARVVYVNYLDVLLIAIGAFRWRKVKFICSIGDLSPAQYGGNALVNKAVSVVEKMLLRRVDVLILSSPFFWDEYYSKIYTGRWQLIENMPRARVWEGFQPKEKKGSCVVGYIGWIRDYKPIECLIEAAGDLRREGLDVRVFFAGFGPDEKRLRSLCGNLDYVDFRGPYQYDRDIRSLYEQIDVVFSVFDIGVANSKILLPNRFYEAIIAGLPIIVAQNTMLAGRVDALGVGYLVDYLSKDEMKAALQSHNRGDEKARAIRQALQSIDKSAYFYEPYEAVLSEVFSSNDRHLSS